MGDFPGDQSYSYQARPTGLNFGEQKGTGVTLHFGILYGLTTSTIITNLCMYPRW